MPYDLDRMSALGFQDAAAALAVAQFGPIVRRLGRGKDGGRDMEANGVLVWSGTDGSPGEAWDGYSVFQVKHHERPSRSKADAQWLWAEIRKELMAWADPDSNRAQVPKHLVFVTNVRLSPEPGAGGLEYVGTRIEEFFADLADTSQDVDPVASERRARRQRLSALKRWKVVEGNQLDAWLDVHDGVRRAYGAFLTSGDVLADLIRLNPELPADKLEPALRVHARNSLVRDRNIYFDEAGGEGAGVPLDRIAVDLPVRVRATGEAARTIAYTLDRGEHVLSPKISTIDKPRHIVLTGAPGNGKTTITRFLVQAYRAAMLAEMTSLGEDHSEVINGTEQKLKQLRRTLPSHRRWAIRIDLAEFAKGYIDNERKSLMSFIARQVTSQTYSRKLEPWQMKDWMATWPWFIALDGLDEVSEPVVRKWVISCVHEFIADAEADYADLLCLVTTRPTGYVDEMSKSQFDRLDLTDLTTAEALAYGHLVTEIRLHTDSARIERVDSLLRSAAANDNLRHLLRTPLQVQIMSIIAEGAGSLDPDRFRLFWRYYDVVARREQAKEHTRFAEILRDHGQQVLDLHERVGLELQRRSESADGGTATMSEEDLAAIAWHVLLDDEFDPAGKDSRLLERIVQAATHRLVLLVPRAEGYGFDVRSLQEMMAARRLTTGALDTVLERLQLLAPSPHWRNTWLFAAGRIFSEPQDHQHERLIDLVENIDAGVVDRFSSIAPVGPYLAWDMLDDGMASAKPKWLRRLVDLGMTAIDYPAPQPVEDFISLAVRMSEFRDDLRIRVRDSLKASLIGDTSSRVNATSLMTGVGAYTDAVPAHPDVRLLAQVKPEPGRSARPDPVGAWEYFNDALENLAPDDVSADVADAAAALLAARTRPLTSDERTKLEATALSPDATELLEVALEKVVRVEPKVAAACFEVARTMTARRELAEFVAP
ncbi:NACHT domain-containing protein [Nocardioides marmorisolisilvae]|uniref:Uncharacterized protein n=1 Tax=Nocardioides marmorisolisilvae TaxID=1542737 RepID=A0A3N0DQ62_9ACTN|nr:hypothetical protein [Nocardioides marmorisolisilvae]RNL77586.1 hypothetical protein EFL95_16385 [Nocardioides marmorisolisilvae]